MKQTKLIILRNEKLIR